VEESMTVDVAPTLSGRETEYSGRWIAVTTQLPPAGVPVIAHYKNSLGKDRRIRAFYAPPLVIEAGSDDLEHEAAYYDEKEDEYYLKEGWYVSNEHEEVHWFVDEPVLHWTPLPPLPRDASETASQANKH
jgi:hypothetical protein